VLEKVTLFSATESQVVQTGGVAVALASVQVRHANRQSPQVAWVAGVAAGSAAVF